MGDPPFSVRVGNRIRQQRRRAGLSQEALARLLPNIRGKQVSRWECGHQFPSQASLAALAAVFGCSEEELVSGSGTAEAPAKALRLVADKIARLAISARYIVTEWDAETEALLGWTAQEAIGRPSWEMTPSTDDPDGRLDRIHELAMTGVWDGALTLIAKDGRRVPVDVHITFDGLGYRSELRPLASLRLAAPTRHFNPTQQQRSTQ